jgi:hypothetical protein
MFLAVLAISLGPKLELKLNRHVPDGSALASHIEIAFRARGFAVENGSVTHSRTLLAAYRDCRAVAAWMRADGYQVARMRQGAEHLGPLRFHYRGRETASFPRIWPELGERSGEIEAAFAGDVRRHPVIAIADNGKCRGELPDWSSFRLGFVPHGGA